jgi:phosphoglycolate phosphatase-like HAD superfamily hydrolase
LWERFSFGGYGSDAEERPDILMAAWKKAEAHLGRPVDAADFVVVGDTPKDIAAAHLVGMACVGVATGRFTAEELRAAGAEDVFVNLLEDGACHRILQARRRA